MKLNRIVVVGTSGSGKSTLAERICQSGNYKNIELDALHWKANWQSTSPEELREKLIREIEDCDRYVIHGNYSSIRDLIWRNVDTVIWLNYKKRIVMWRVIKRTIRRIVTKEKLWNGNVETIKNSILAKDAIINWAWTTYSKRKEQYEKLTKQNPYQIENIVVFNEPKEADDWVKKNVLTTGST
jgi:adenylate kinase family enzyme